MKAIKIPPYEDAIDVLIHREKASYSALSNEKHAAIKMNKSMAESLARQLLYFAVNSLPTGSHIHYDTFFCPLKQGNYEVVISQIENNEIELRIELDEEAEL